MNISLYDFTKHRPLTAGEKAGLRSFFEQLSIETILPFRFECESLEQMPKSVFLQTIPSTSFVFDWAMHSSNSKGFVALDAELIYVIVDLLLGGEGKNFRLVHEPNMLEKALQVKWVDSFLSSIFAHIVDKSFTIRSAEPLSPSNHPYVVVRLQTVYDGKPYSIAFCLLKEHLNTLISTSFTNTEEQASIHVDQVEFTLKAVLGKTTLSKEDVNLLQIGDIIPLNQSLSDQISVYVGDKKMFSAQPGYSEQYKGIQLCQI